jgi:hypothetical protein
VVLQELDLPPGLLSVTEAPAAAAVSPVHESKVTVRPRRGFRWSPIKELQSVDTLKYTITTICT